MRYPYLLLIVAAFIALSPMAIFPRRAFAAQTVVQRELFDSIQTLNASNTDQFSSIHSGYSYYARAVGPYVSPDVSPGWSADEENQIGLGGIMTLSTGTASSAQNNGMTGMWIRFKSFSASGTVAIPLDLRTLTGADHSSVQMTVSPTGTLYDVIYQGTTTYGPTLNLDTWYYLAISWVTTGTNTFTFKAYYTTSTSNFTPFDTQTGVNQFNKLEQVNFGSNSSQAWEGRIGAPGIYSVATSSDIGYPSDLSAPYAGRNTWYIDPVNGNDNNTGISSGSAWKTATKFNTESQYSGLIDTRAGYANGDILMINTSSTAQLNIATTSFNLNTQGLTMEPYSGEQYVYINSSELVNNAGFTKTAGASYTYQSTDTAATAVIWDNNVWLNHPTASASSTAIPLVDATPGSFWTDGTNMYVHPFDNSNPATNGRTYVRSNPLSASNVVNMDAPDEYVTGIYTGYTTTADPVTNLPQSGYGISANNNTGNSLIANSYVFYCSKHGIGSVDSSQSSTLTIQDSDVEQCSPYSGNTDYVVYNGTSNTGNVRTFIRDKTLAANGLIGSTVGTSTSGEAWLSHNLSGSNQFSSVTLQDCYFPLSDVSAGISVVNFSVSATKPGRSVIGSLDSSASSTTVSNTLFDYTFFDQTGGTALIQNSLIVPARSGLDTGWIRTIAGNVTVKNTTIDMSNVLTSSTSTSGLFQKAGTTQLTFINNAFKVPVGKSYTIGEGFTASDTLTFINNAYQFASGTYVMNQYNSGASPANLTFAQWQGLGFDSGSISPSSLKLNANYKPQVGSPLLGAGQSVGPLTDYVGQRTYTTRNTIGAFQGTSGTGPLGSSFRW